MWKIVWGIIFSWILGTWFEILAGPFIHLVGQNKVQFLQTSHVYIVLYRDVSRVSNYLHILKRSGCRVLLFWGSSTFQSRDGSESYVVGLTFLHVRR